MVDSVAAHLPHLRDAVKQACVSETFAASRFCSSEDHTSPYACNRGCLQCVSHLFSSTLTPSEPVIGAAGRLGTYHSQKDATCCHNPQTSVLPCARSGDWLESPSSASPVVGLYDVMSALSSASRRSGPPVGPSQANQTYHELGSTPELPHRQGRRCPRSCLMKLEDQSQCRSPTVTALVALEHMVMPGYARAM